MLVTMAAGLRVTIPRPPAKLTRAAFSGPAFKGSGVVIPLHQRNPERRLPPDLVDDLPTPLEPEARRSPIVIDPLPPKSQYRVLWSMLQIARYLSGWLSLKLTGKLDARHHATVTRQLFERMSGVWIKVGQLLSLRSDLLSADLVRELASLQYQARGFPSAVALQVVEEELRQPIKTVFSYFDPLPFAAASIAQVHRATLLHNGRAVVVKIMRPDVKLSFARDLKILEWIVLWSGRLRLFRRFHLSEGLEELRAILQEETNYKYEAVNLKRMRKNLKAHGVYVPRAVARLSSERILVIEEVAGVLMSQFLEARNRDPDRAHRWALVNGIEERELARTLSITVLRQILEDNEFHGDLHPGNIMLLADSKIALIDFGSVGRLNRHTWELYRASLGSMAMRDYARAADLLLMMSPAIAVANNKRLRADMTAALHDWELATGFPGLSYAERSMSAMSEKVSQVMANHRVPVSWAIMRVGRSLTTLDASLQTLVPDQDFLSLCRAYFRDQQRRAWSLEGQRKALGGLVAQASAFGSDVKLLLLAGVRDQALRLHGMLDGLTRAKIVALVFVERFLLLAMVALLDVFAFDVYFRHLPDEEHWHILPSWIVRDISEIAPTLRPTYWLLFVAFAGYLFRMVRAVRLSIIARR